MNKLRAIIVDDSSFSVALIKNILEKKNIEVVDTAMTVNDAVLIAKQHKPDLITMDVTLLDGDGIECTKLIRNEKVESKVIIISSMKDDEIIKMAKNAGVNGYLQKPIDEVEFHTLLDRLFAGDELYEVLRNHFKAAFEESFYTNIKRIIGGKVEIRSISEDLVLRESLGVSVAIGFNGRHSGRMLMDMKYETLECIFKKICLNENYTREDVLAFFSEIGNIIAGNGASLLNGLNRGLGIRVAPPTVFGGKDVMMSLGEFENESIEIGTKYGDIFLNIGFKKGDETWM